MVRRKYYRRRYNDSFGDLIAGLFTLFVIAFAFYFFANPEKSIEYISILFVVIIGFIFLVNWLNKKHFSNLLERLRKSGKEEALKNFINRWGLEDGKVNGYEFRNHRFDWNRINDLKKEFKKEGVTSREKDIFKLLRFYIQEKEEKLTTEAIKVEPQKFSLLTGGDFEKLLYRLFEKMGYKVEHIGRSGDQGWDLIANLNGERILIQAKCYRDWSTGNAAVQQVVGATKLYNCNRAMVITTSYFTPEAISLAKANKTELISREQLQELLLKYLGESWL